MGVLASSGVEKAAYGGDDAGRVGHGGRLQHGIGRDGGRQGAHAGDLEARDMLADLEGDLRANAADQLALLQRQEGARAGGGGNDGGDVEGAEAAQVDDFAGNALGGESLGGVEGD